MQTPTRPTIADELMTADPVCVDATAELMEIVQLLDLQDVSGLPVLDRQGRVIGVVSKTDVLAEVAGHTELTRRPLGQALAELRAGKHEIDWNITAEDLVQGEPVTCFATDPVPTVARRMSQERVHRVVVVDADRRPVGIVTSMDLVDHYSS